MPLERHALDKGGDHYMNLSYRNLSSIVVFVFVKKRFVFGFAVRFASFRHGRRRGRCIVCLERGLDWWDANRTLVVVIVVIVVIVVVVAGGGTIADTARFGFVGSFRFVVGSFDVHVLVVVVVHVLWIWIVNSDFHHVAVIDDIDDGLHSYCAEALVIVPSSVYTFPTNLGPNVVRGSHRKFLSAYAFHNYPVVHRPRLIERDATTLSSLFDDEVGALQTKR